MLIKLFSTPETNPNNAQLLFSTHDISLFDKELFRRDQIFIVDKELDGQSKLHRLSEFTGITKMANWRDWYMAGLFNGIPAINSYAIDLKFTKPVLENAAP